MQHDARGLGHRDGSDIGAALAGVAQFPGQALERGAAALLGLHPRRASRVESLADIDDGDGGPEEQPGDGERGEHLGQRHAPTVALAPPGVNVQDLRHFTGATPAPHAAGSRLQSSAGDRIA